MLVDAVRHVGVLIFFKIFEENYVLKIIFCNFLKNSFI